MSFVSASRLFGVTAFFAFLCHAVQAITLDEGLQDPAKYIFYDQLPFRVGIHAVIALVITWGILGTFISSVMLIAKSLERKKKPRIRTMSH